jgi:hAT family C-terminal dimerisation region
MTRWGTQFRLINSVLKSKDALRRFAFEHPAVELPDNAMNHITSKKLWADLEPMRELLQPLDEAIRMSESVDTRLATVCTRWDAIDTHLNRMQVTFPELVEFLKPDGVASKRFERQLHPIHITAFFLSPANRSTQLTEEAEKSSLGFFQCYSKSKESEKILRTEYLHYRLQRGVFRPLHVCWEHVNEPLEFWMLQMSHTQFLGQLAYRIHSTPVNSVSSERAFSTQNYIHTKDRNSLHFQRVNKLIDAYINSRILERIDAEVGKGLIPSPYKLSELEEVELEQNLLECEDLIEFDEYDNGDEAIMEDIYSMLDDVDDV